MVSSMQFLMGHRFCVAKCGLAWGLTLWFFGYVLGFVFFALMPPEKIGWYIFPIGLAVTVLVLWKWVRPQSLTTGLAIGAIWCALAVVLDYIFIVKLLAPSDGYYKLDVYIYYVSTLLLPVIAALLGWGRRGG